MFEPVPIELLVLLDAPAQRTRWLRAGHATGVLVATCLDADTLLSQLHASPPDGIVLPLGERASSSLQICETLQQRPLHRWVPIFLLDDNTLPAHMRPMLRDLGVDQIIPAAAPRQVLETLRELVDVPMETEIPADWVDPPRRSAPTRAHHATSPSVQGTSEASMLIPIDVVSPPWQQAAHDLQRMLFLARTRDYFALLGLDYEADTPTIQDAFERLESRFHTSTLPPLLTHHHQADLEELWDILEDAWCVLADPTHRARYLRGLVQQDAS